MGMLKKAASGVLALLPCSRTSVRSARQHKGFTLRDEPSDSRPAGRCKQYCGFAGRTPCLHEDMFFDHSPRLLTSVVPWAFTRHGREIFNRRDIY